MAVTITNKYPAGTAGGNSLDIVVSAFETVSVVLFVQAGTALPDMQCSVQRKLSTGNYQNVPEGTPGVPAYITNERPEVVLSAPGTYRVVIPATAVAVILEENR